MLQSLPLSVIFEKPLILAAGIAVALMFASCNRQETDSGGEDGATSVEGAPGGSGSAVLPPAEGAASSEPAGSVSLRSVGLVSDDLHVEPAKDDWKAEIINDGAARQLAQLSHLLESGRGTIAVADIESMAVASITSTRLVPEVTVTTFEDAAFTVMTAPDSALQDEPYRGHSGFVDALTALTALFSAASERHAKFKIFTVDDTPGSLSTTAYFEMTGRIPTGWYQQVSTWECNWSIAAGSDPLLASVTVSGFESSLGKSDDNRSLLSDCTGSVFEGVKSFSEQLSQPIDHWVARIGKQFGISVAGWHGLALGDVNGDGLDDIYVCQPGGLPDRLYIQKADGSVFDASSLSGVDWRIQTQSALFVDLDNDGDQDLVLATTLGVIFLGNDGRGTFTVQGSELIPDAAPLALACADFDLDGDLDVYAGCYSMRRSSIEEQVLGRPIPYHDANNGGRNVLFRNDQDWRFTHATVDCGLDQNNRRFTLAASWEDYDDDGDPDLYVANDYGRNNLYRNDPHPEGGRTFVDVAAEAGVEDISAGMSVSWSDANLDGKMDLYVSNMWSSAGNRITYQRQFQSGAGGDDMAAFQRHARGNSLFINRGDGTFTDASLEAGVSMGRWAWGSRFIDLNSDGLEDIYVANGFITQPDDTGDL
ncbi:MAG: hypothetical protein ACI9R3_001879 [Verrucomicrobiales bacterium]|jgi:hypothetical protein